MRVSCLRKTTWGSVLETSSSTIDSSACHLERRLQQKRRNVSWTTRRRQNRKEACTEADLQTNSSARESDPAGNSSTRAQTVGLQNIEKCQTSLEGPPLVSCTRISICVFILWWRPCESATVIYINPPHTISCASQANINGTPPSPHAHTHTHTY